MYVSVAFDPDTNNPAPLACAAVVADDATVMVKPEEEMLLAASDPEIIVVAMDKLPEPSNVPLPLTSPVSAIVLGVNNLVAVDELPDTLPVTPPTKLAYTVVTDRFLFIFQRSVALEYVIVAFDPFTVMPAPLAAAAVVASFAIVKFKSVISTVAAEIVVV